MVNREILLSKALKIEDKLLLSRVYDAAEKCERSCKEVHTDFLDPNQQKIVEISLKAVKSINYSFEGGYQGAERKVLLLRPDFMFSENGYDENNFMELLRITPKGNELLTHRDYLGSIMALGIKREKIGDILVRDKNCDLIVLKEISQFIIYNLDKVSNTRVKIDLFDFSLIEESKSDSKEVKTTVASLRLDSVAGSGFGLSRSKMVEFIKAGKVHLNWQETNDPSKVVNKGDVITIRGRGRVVFEEITGKSKKDRFGIILKKLI